MTLPKLPIFLENDLRLVDQMIREAFHSEVALVPQVCEHIVRSGGKRIRPKVLLLVANALAYHGTSHHTLAAVIELIHTATLLHDDVVDESSLRRGEPSANALFGNASSVLVGDFLYSRAFHTVLKTEPAYLVPCLRVLSEASTCIAEGEVLQLMNCKNPDVDEIYYQKVIESKTAKLFEAATQMAAIISGVSPKTEQKLAAYGRYLGLSFQLADDVLDYSGDESEIGKHLGDDLAEGKMTLPLIYVMQNGTSAQKAMVKAAITEGSRDALPRVKEAIETTNALLYTRQRAQMAATKAQDCLDALPPSEAKTCLLELAHFSATRSF